MANRVQSYDAPTTNRYIRAMGRGGSNAQLLRYSDERLYVTKFLQNPQGGRVLTNELLASRIGRQLGTPIPKSGVVEIPQGIIDTTPASQRLGFLPGYCFGSEYLEAEGMPYPQVLALVTNIQDLIAIVAMDTLLNNVDRAGNVPGNLLVAATLDGPMVYAIDHGHILGGPRWRLLERSDPTHVEVVCPDTFLPWIQPDHLSDIVGRLATLTPGKIDTVLDTIPEEWDAPSEQLTHVQEVLVARVEPTIAILRDQFSS